MEDMRPHHYRDIPPRNERIEMCLEVFVATHAMLLALFGVLANFDQGKNQSSEGSPSAEQDWIMVAAIVVLLIYVLMLLQEFNLRIQNSTYSEILGKYSLLCGFLATILLVLTLIPGLGWTLFALWLIYFVKASLDLHTEVSRLIWGGALQALDLLSLLILGRGLREGRTGLPV